jgi:hypothetical protein
LLAISKSRWTKRKRKTPNNCGDFQQNNEIKIFQIFSIESIGDSDESYSIRKYSKIPIGQKMRKIFMCCS